MALNDYLFLKLSRLYHWKGKKQDNYEQERRLMNKPFVAVVARG
jgi:hypothetical protein